MRPVKKVNQGLECSDNSMSDYYADLHIHIGSARNKAVKITASRRMDLRTIIFDDAPRKGLDIIGIVDAGSTLVSYEIEEMLAAGDLTELKKGGFLAKNDVLLITGCEVESREGVHLITYLPNLKSIRNWQKYIKSRVHNMQLSTQKVNANIMDIIRLSTDLEGIFCPAHAFTPHKGVYGMWTDKLANKLGSDFKYIRVMEIGLSADSNMADLLAETKNFTLLSNSDAHSSANIGREFNRLCMNANNFQELKLCLENKQGRRIAANYGLHPRLGKYHRTFCPVCGTIIEDQPPVTTCSSCGNSKIIMGVLDRICIIKDYDTPDHPQGRPPYYYRIPLKDLPGIGPMTYNKLLGVTNEIELMEHTLIEDIIQVGGQSAADIINAMRQGRLSILPGGGGKYGKVRKDYRN